MCSGWLKASFMVVAWAMALVHTKPYGHLYGASPLTIRWPGGDRPPTGLGGGPPAEGPGERGPPAPPWATAAAAVGPGGGIKPDCMDRSGASTQPKGHLFYTELLSAKSPPGISQIRQTAQSYFCVTFVLLLIICGKRPPSCEQTS